MEGTVQKFATLLLAFDAAKEAASKVGADPQVVMDREEVPGKPEYAVADKKEAVASKKFGWHHAWELRVPKPKKNKPKAKKEKAATAAKK